MQPEQPGMLISLGQALYYTANAIALLIFAVGVLLALTEPNGAGYLILAVPAFLVWLVGRALLYILSGH